MTTTGRGFMEAHNRNLASFLIATGYGVLVVAGCVGLYDKPAASVQTLVGYTIVSTMWNFAFIIGGLTGIIARVTGARRVEIVALDVVGAVLIMWACVIFASMANFQAAVAFVAFALLFFGWANGTRRYLNQLQRVTEQLKEE